MNTCSSPDSAEILKGKKPSYCDSRDLTKHFNDKRFNIMNCGHSCQCQHSWPLDTLGLKRDPISCEKGWLDFAVRLLSREVVGKGRGQETVWNDKCKPDWWDRDVGVSWKNPTSNPKDTKEVLQKKFSALQDHLVAEGRFPKELEEEARLWNAGLVKELFLQTTLASLLSRVYSLHVAMDDACKQVKDLNAHVNADLVNNLKNCLGATLKAIENFHHTKPAAVKRHCSHDGKENNTSGSEKSRKLEHPPTVHSKSKQENVAQSSSSQNVATQSSSSQNTREILAVAQRIMDKRKREKHHAVGNVKKIFPKPTLLPHSDSIKIVAPVKYPVMGVSQVYLPAIGVSTTGLTYILNNTSNPKRSTQSNTHTLAAISPSSTDPLVKNISREPVLSTFSPSTTSPSLSTNPETRYTLWLAPNSIKSVSSDNILTQSPVASNESDFISCSSSSGSASSNPFSDLILSTHSPHATSPSSIISTPETGSDLRFSPNSAFSCLSQPASNESGFISSPLSLDPLSSDSAGSANSYNSPHLDDCFDADSFADQHICSDTPFFDNLSPFGNPDRTLDLTELKDQESALDLDFINSLWEEDGSSSLLNYLQDI
ncbi:hypothetical protein Btru_045996 [Bulinus truncatus]|nr:hypothetical protein Btru_045996 [Bulinus truncatus]